MSLKRGEQGGEVVSVQENLLRLGYQLPISKKSGDLDGKLGGETLREARLFEQDRGLKLSPNDTINDRTLSELKAAPLYTRGLDLSHYNGTPDFRAIKAAGYAFVILRATLGRATVDERIYKGAQEALSAGLFVSLYHFWYPDRDPEQQADFFTKVSQKALGSLNFNPCWDVERDVELTPEEINEGLTLALHRLKQNFGGRRPCVYTSKRVYTEYGLLSQGGRTLNGVDVAGKEADLWIVRWASERSIVQFGPWDDWLLWQSGPAFGVPGTHVAGTNGLTDRNLCKLKGDELGSFFYYR